MDEGLRRGVHGNGHSTTPVALIRGFPLECPPTHMAHFESPPDGLLGEYDIDGKLALGSVWRMSIGLDGDGADIALHGGAGLSVRSNDPSVVANPIPERAAGTRRVFRLRGAKLGVTMLQAGLSGSTPDSWAAGSPWVSLQVQVKATLRSLPTGDPLVVLSPPQMALNSFDTPTRYEMKFTRTINPATSPANVIQHVVHAGRLRHLVLSCHGEIVFDRSSGRITDSIVHIAGQNQPGFDRSNVELFAQLRPVMQGGVIWFGSCAIGNDIEVNYARAQASGCYIVAPCMYMQSKPGQKGQKRCPPSRIDMFARFQPRVFSPDRTPISYAALLGMQELGIRV